MLNNQPTSFIKKLLFVHYADHLFDPFQFIGGVSEDQVEFFAAMVQEADGGRPDGFHLGKSQLCGSFAHEPDTTGVDIDRNNLPAAPGSKLI